MVHIAAVLVSLAAGGFLLWGALKYLAGILLPLFLAYLASLLLRPIVAWIANRTRLSRKMCAAALSLVLIVLVVSLLVRLSGKLASEVSDFVSEMADRNGGLSGILTSFQTAIREKFPASADFFASPAYETAVHALQQAASSFGGKLTSFLTALCGALPNRVFSVFVCVISIYYLISDPDGVADSLREILPKDFLHGAGQVVSRVVGAVFGYMRAYFAIMLVTFFELFVGLSVLGVRYAAVVSLLIAFADALPVLGAGGILGIWAVSAFFGGRTAFGVGLLILGGIMYIVRQFMEPKLLGRFIGVHPFVALAAVFAGYKLCGVLGMIAAPVALYTIKAAREAREETMG